MSTPQANGTRSGAWLEPRLQLDGAASGPLQGVTCAIKDLFDIKGHVTGHGNPVWLETHEPAAETAPAVQALLDAGARVVGKTHMDELAYSLQGENPHYGTPRNPACPDRIPGGSSSGSVVAVAGGEADMAMGSDTGGSVRVPASFCGTYGIRPSHGRVNMQGSCALATSFDTGGWFAKDAPLLRRVGDVLLDKGSRKQVTFKRWLVSKDAFQNCDEATSKAIYDAMSKQGEKVKQLLGQPEEVTVAPGQPCGALEDWQEVFRICQGKDAWEDLGSWVSSHEPKFGPGTKDRFEMASKLTEEEAAEERAKRETITDHLNALLGDDAVMTLPTTPGPAPKLQTPMEDMDLFRKRMISLTCIAGLCRLPQVSLPVGKVDGCPIGLSLIGPRGSDEALLQLAEQLMPLLQ